MMGKRVLTIRQRREIFAAAVSAQDDMLDVPAARKWVSKKYKICPSQVAAIEEEGLERDWPLPELVEAAEYSVLADDGDDE